MNTIQKTVNAILEGQNVRTAISASLTEESTGDELDILIRKAKEAARELKASVLGKSIEKLEVTTGMDDCVSLDLTPDEIRAKLEENSWYVDETKYLLIHVYLTVDPVGIDVVERRLYKMFHSDVDTSNYADYGLVTFSVDL